jgi:predicted lactoylglutathione lyase
MFASNQPKDRHMNLGAFSISLAVKDIGASKAFYEKFGFEVFGGDIDKNWLIMKNGGHVIGLFQGMFVPSQKIVGLKFKQITNKKHMWI